ncbi:hypothetical protein MBAV_003482 [Candidatus Magnetobacterium bavaricum]|uniref:Uncharacterized protein n=1 Tax=Candidatus Magnetobacterium bavaricum TaxID=29290 RepID=A0A0F3GUI0_9BACT|nr:hypothetical protein MBAV_003482 [Candidatus Magnetobacterium bavaricum]
MWYFNGVKGASSCPGQVRQDCGSPSPCRGDLKGIRCDFYAGGGSPPGASRNSPLLCLFFLGG